MNNSSTLHEKQQNNNQTQTQTQAQSDCLSALWAAVGEKGKKLRSNCMKDLGDLPPGVMEILSSSWPYYDS